VSEHWTYKKHEDNNYRPNHLPSVPLSVYYDLKSTLFARSCQSLSTGSNIHKFGIWWVRGQGKLSPIKPIKMIKSCLFLLLINIVMIRNAFQKAVITKAEMMISEGKCG
jgi:hypothetical protein